MKKLKSSLAAFFVATALLPATSALAPVNQPGEVGICIDVVFVRICLDL